MSSQRPGPGDRARQAVRLLRSEGLDSVVSRLRTRVARRLEPPNRRLPVSRAEFDAAARAAAQGWVLPGPAPSIVGEPPTIAWLCTPPPAGSGGHTTIFRMVTALERAGHRCVVYVHDEHGWSIDQHVRTIRRWWPWMPAEVRSAAAGISDAHAIFATSWETAWTLLTVPAAGVRCYFVQDFEPSFYPAGSEYLLAEATYSFPYEMVTAGPWLAQMLAARFGASTRHFDFGTDATEYRLATTGQNRDRICYYCRPETPRRAHELAVVALQMFADQHPEVEIHCFGQAAVDLPFRAVNRGLLSPAELNELYNSCVAGLVLSATNASLVPHEMLAAGCIPVVNDAEHNRLVLDNDHIAYCPPVPHAIATRLAALVDRDRNDVEQRARQAAGSVGHSGWSRGEDQVVDAVAAIVEQHSPSGKAAQAD